MNIVDHTMEEVNALIALGYKETDKVTFIPKKSKPKADQTYKERQRLGLKF